MAKVSSIMKNKRRERMSKRYAAKRESLRKIIHDMSVPADQRFQAMIKLSELPRNSAKIRVMNRCNMTGRPHSVYRKFGLSRIALRDLASNGQIPGLVKASW